MSAIAWEPYLGLPPATEAQVAQAEQQLGVKFPGDFREALKQHQGQLPVPRRIESARLAPVGFGPILHVEEQPAHALLQVAKVWRDFYPDIVPIAASGGGSCFAYDFGADEENPPIVFVDHEADPEEEGGLIPVAGSFSELLGRLKD